MKRIEQIALLTKGIDTLLDIGTDHGYLIIEAIQKGYIKKAIGADINFLPLENAKKNISNSGLSDLVTFALSDGFLNVKDPYDGVVIAGMGMHLCKRILSQPHPFVKKYIVSVHTHLTQFRQFLSASGFEILDEHIVHEKFYYVIFTLIKNKVELDAEQQYLGPHLRYKKASLPYYEHLLKINQNIIKMASLNRVEYLDIQNNWLINAIESLKNID